MKLLPLLFLTGLVCSALAQSNYNQSTVSVCLAARCEETEKTRTYSFSRDVHLFSIRNNLRGYYDSGIEESPEQKQISPEKSKPIKKCE